MTCAYHGRDNLAVDLWGRPLPAFGRYGETRAKLIEAKQPVVWPQGLPVLASRDVETHLLWPMPARGRGIVMNMIVRVLFFVAEGRGEIIDDEKTVGGYPVQQGNPRAVHRGGLEPR